MTDEATRAAAAAERAAIKVESFKPVEEEVVEAATTEETTLEESVEEVVEAVEAVEESDEVKSLKAQLEKERQKFEKRINKKTAEGKELAAKIADLEKVVAAKSAEDGERLTEADVERKAEEKVAQREFVAACNRLAEAAKKIDKDFDDKIKQLSDDTAPLPGYMIGILDDLDNGGAILNYFTSNPDEYEEIIGLSQAKMAIKLSKLSTKIETEAKVKPKPTSKIPEPITPVGGRGGSGNAILTENDTKDMDSFVRKRAAMVEQRRKMGHYNAR